MKQVVVVDGVVINVLYYIYLSILSRMIFFLVDYFGPILRNIDVRGGAPFFQNISEIRIHFGYGLWLYICLWRKIGSIFFLEINTNALGNKTMCIITWFLQFCSFLAKPVQMRAWNIHVYILTFVYPVSDAFKQMNMAVLYILQSAWIRWLNSPYPSNRNSVCIYRALNFIGYSKSILCTLLNEFTFFLSAREHHLLYFDFFSLVQQWQWKNHLNFNGMESVIFNQNMICKLLKRYQIVKVNAR